MAGKAKQKPKEKPKAVTRAAGDAGTPQRQQPRRRLLRLALWPLRLAAYAMLLAVAWVAAYAVIDPPGGYYMASERLRLGSLEHRWRDLSAISPHLARAAMAAEDSGFCDHPGLDFAAIEAALDANAKGRRLRGASTISQQVAKNVFLWHGRSWARKGLEAGFTLLIEAIWGKRRILEVYLNVAEFGEGVFGAEAAARHYFDRPASELTLAQAARLAAVLPDPKGRDPRRDTAFMAKRAAAVAAGAQTLAAEGRDACIR